MGLIRIKKQKGREESIGNGVKEVFDPIPLSVELYWIRWVMQNRCLLSKKYTASS